MQHCEHAISTLSLQYQVEDRGFFISENNIRAVHSSNGGGSEPCSLKTQRVLVARRNREDIQVVDTEHLEDVV
jgi:hypothetical protein